jgi:hypothetical protein
MIQDDLDLAILQHHSHELGIGNFCEYAPLE